MNVTPLAFESLGVRSMATLVEAGGKRVVIDPSAALGPLRYGLPPHALEIQALSAAKEKIREAASSSDALVVTHYHYDHHDSSERFYGGKTVFAKDVNASVNKSQAERGRYFARQMPPDARLIYADGGEYEFGPLKMRFSPPVPHGPPGTRLGYVLMVRAEAGGRVLVHTSDVQGPVDEAAAEWIIGAGPDLLIVDGPPTYLLGYRFTAADMERAKANLLRIIRKTGCEVVLEHHLLRDMDHRELYAEAYAAGNVKSAAGYLGGKDNLLEMQRKTLWGAGA